MMRRALLSAALVVSLAGCEWVTLPVRDRVYDADGDGFDGLDDCDDFNDNVFPFADERCNGIDNNCSGSEDDAEDAVTWYADADRDGFGDPGAPVTACTAPLGYIGNRFDCDDTSPAINPSATESDCADPVDYNCDGVAGGGDSDRDGSPDCEDCLARDATVFPGADERCNGADDDCDGVIDEDLTGSLWYADADGDGWGDASAPLSACQRPDGYSADATDCDDADPAEHPSAAEACDGLDNDCDGAVDEPDRFGNTRWYTDADGDTFGDPVGWVAACAPVADRVLTGDDCDDTDPTIHPTSPETCDGADQDCDGTLDEDAVDARLWYRDLDNDGYGTEEDTRAACRRPVGFVVVGGDCDDVDFRVSPGDPEVCGGGDENCDGRVDEDGATGGEVWYVDGDGDGFGDDATTLASCTVPAGALDVGGDCDDADPVVYPGALEVDCGDPIDYNCDGSAGRVDADADGWDACEDCQDDDPTRSPDAVETCDAVDSDCDGDPDDNAIDATLWYTDADADGFGDAATAVAACDPPASGGVTEPGDCDDADSAVSPGATETCATALDDDCDGETNRGADDCAAWYVDADGDGFGGDDTVCLCEADGAYTLDVGGDCDDTDVATNPGAAEVCANGIDDDCDGGAPDCGVAGRVDLAGATGGVITGLLADDNLGAAVASAGDLDGDGLADLFAGVPGADDGGADGGGAWLFAGPFGAWTTADADAAWLAASDDDSAGSALGVGDLDGDGALDLVVGAPYEAGNGAGAGAAFVVRGPLGVGGGTLTTADVWRGTDTNDLAGMALAVLDDSDGDGDAELAVGAYRESRDSGNAGAVYVLGGTAGSGTLADVADARLYGVGSADFFGRSVARAGDVDGDGLGDLVVGAYSDDTGGSNSGAAYVFYGPFAADRAAADADAVRYGARGDAAGFGLAAGEDTNGDGYADLAVGAFNNDTAATSAGAAYVLFGPLSGTSALGSEVALLGVAASDNAGAALSFGDLDADGVPDLAVLSDGVTTGNVGAWVAYGPFAGVTSLGDAGATIIAAASGDLTAAALLFGGDTDGDGFGDLILGAGLSDDAGADAGAVYVLPGGPGL